VVVPSLFLFFLFMFNSDISPPLLLSPSSPLKKLEKSPNRRPILYSVIGKRKQERTATRKMGNNAATVSDGVSSDEESAAMLLSRDSIDRTSLCACLCLCLCLCVFVCALQRLKNIFMRGSEGRPKEAVGEAHSTLVTNSRVMFEKIQKKTTVKLSCESIL